MIQNFFQNHICPYPRYIISQLTPTVWTSQSVPSSYINLYQNISPLFMYFYNVQRLLLFHFNCSVDPFFPFVWSYYFNMLTSICCYIIQDMLQFNYVTINLPIKICPLVIIFYLHLWLLRSFHTGIFLFERYILNTKWRSTFVIL